MTWRARAAGAWRVVLAGLVVVLLAGCGGDPDAVAWRGLDLRLPEAWVVVQQSDDLLYVGNGTSGQEAGEAGDLTVGMQFLVEDTPTVQAWRDLVNERDGEIEVDTAGDLDGIPTSVLQFTLPERGGSVPATRERVIVVTARDLVILAQAVPERGQADGPQLFLDDLDEIEAVLDSITFGAPVDD